MTAEALAAGRPVVGFADRPGTSELVQHGVNGLLVDMTHDRPGSFADALRQLIADQELRARLGQAGPASVARFSGFPADIDRGVLAAFLRRACIPAPHTIYRNVHKVMPGTTLTIASDGRVTSRAFWSLEEEARQGIAARGAATSDEAVVDELEQLLAEAVSDRMLADVPVGAFLSGGIDSSTVVALMQRASSTAVRTYSIGSRSAGYDEAPQARAVADHLGTDHTEFYVDAAGALDVIPKLPTMLDEPFADPTIIPTYLVSALARQDVTVALSGDGGDEVFGGYTRHLVASSRMAGVLKAPLAARRLAGRAVLGVPTAAWGRVGRLLPANRRPPRLGEQLHKAAGSLVARDIDDLYAKLASHWQDPRELVRAADEPCTWAVEDPLDWIQHPMERMLYRDTLGYLPDDALAKVDRATMAVLLEGRVPLIDHRVVEHLRRVPPEFKVRSETAGRSGCCGRWRNGLSPGSCWNGRSKASASRSTTGCAGRYGPGPRNFSIRRVWT